MTPSAPSSRQLILAIALFAIAILMVPCGALVDRAAYRPNGENIVDLERLSLALYCTAGAAVVGGVVLLRRWQAAQRGRPRR